MEIRLLGFVILLLLGYLLRRQSKSPPRIDAIMCLLLAAVTVIVLGLIWFFTGSTISWATDFFLKIPFDAAVAGLVVGYILADQQMGAEETIEKSATGLREEKPNKDTRGKSGLDVITQIPAALWHAAPSLALVVVVLLAVVHPDSWTRALSRVHIFKAAGVEVGLAPAAGDKVTQGIRNAAPPRGQFLGGPGTIDRHGFIGTRIERMATLTHQPEFRLQARVSSGSHPTLPENPTAFLFTTVTINERGPSAPNPGNGATIRAVQRDRAMLMHLQRGKDARDTRADDGPSTRLAAGSREIDQGVGQLGATQAGLLSLLARHVSCIKQFVHETGDRRLLEYRTQGVNEALYLLAHKWSSIEHAEVLRRVGPTAVSNNALDKQRRDQLITQARKLADALDRFTEWANEVRNHWTAVSRPSNGSATEPEPTASGRPAARFATPVRTYQNSVPDSATGASTAIPASQTQAAPPAILARIMHKG